MKSFNVDKILKTSASQIRLGSLQLTATQSEAGADSINNDKEKEEALSKSRPYPCSNVFRTPMCFIHTQTGSIPHITPEVLELIYPKMTCGSLTEGCGNLLPPIQISMDSTIRFGATLEKFQKGISKFVGLPGLPSFLTIHDPLQGLRSGHNDKFGIALWSRHGRTSLTPEKYTTLLGAFQPNLSQIISDYDVHPESSGMKRLRKSLSRAEDYTARCVEQKLKQKFQAGLFITVEAAWFQMDRELATKTVAKLLETQHQIVGVVIAGLTDRFLAAQEGPISKTKNSDRHDAERLTICQAVDMQLVEDIVKVLPATIPKYVVGPVRLLDMVNLMSSGFDIFDSSVASRMADDGEVFLLDQLESNVGSLAPLSVHIIDSNNEGLPERGGSFQEKDMETEQESSVISLKDKRFFDDFRPIASRCTCYTCRKHTRSYVHHLYATDELLGPVLVQIHNLTALDRFFKIMRGMIQDTDCADSIEEKISFVQKILRTPSNNKVSLSLETDKENESIRTGNS